VGRELSPTELRELLGAYALDAVDADERRQVEAYLARTPAAVAELSELRETAALLAHVGREAPDGLWTRIEGALAEEPPRLVLPAARTRGRVLTRVGIAAAFAVVVASITVTAVLHGEMDDQQARLDRLSASVARNGVTRAANAAAMDPSSRVAMLVSADGRHRAKVVTTPDGTGFFMEHNLPQLAPGRTYQLWAMTGNRAAPVMVSVGVLGRRPAVTPFRAGTAAMGFVVTVEETPGVAATDHPPMLEGFTT
jgi:anti-sigma factor RsiW